MSWLVISWGLVLSGCRPHKEDYGTIEVELFEGDSLTIVAVNETGEIWLQDTGIRDTTWRLEAKAPDGTGLAWSILYDLTPRQTGVCLFSLDLQVTSRDGPIPATFPVGYGSASDAPFVRPILACPEEVYGLLVGVDQMKSVGVHFEEGQLEIDPERWPSLVGRFKARVSLEKYISW